MSTPDHDALAVVHVACANARARRELILTRMPRLGAAAPSTPRAWYFADIPAGLSTDPLEVVMEVAMLHQRSDPAVNRELDSWVNDAYASGLIVSSMRVSRSLVLDPDLFLGGRVPEFFVAATARHSARAATLLRDPAIDVGAEIDAIFAELIAEGDRRRALDLYAAWLEHVATNNVPRAAGTPPAWALQASYVARLAHMQVLRLQGPESGDGLLQEAALVRTLLSSRRTGTGT